MSAELCIRYLCAADRRRGGVFAIRRMVIYRRRRRRRGVPPVSKYRQQIITRSSVATRLVVRWVVPVLGCVSRRGASTGPSR